MGLLNVYKFQKTIKPLISNRFSVKFYNSANPTDTDDWVQYRVKSVDLPTWKMESNESRKRFGNTQYVIPLFNFASSTLKITFIETETGAVTAFLSSLLFADGGALWNIVKPALTTIRIDQYNETMTQSVSSHIYVCRIKSITQPEYSNTSAAQIIEIGAEFNILYEINSEKFGIDLDKIRLTQKLDVIPEDKLLQNITDAKKEEDAYLKSYGDSLVVDGTIGENWEQNQQQYEKALGDWDKELKNAQKAKDKANKNVEAAQLKFDETIDLLFSKYDEATRRKISTEIRSGLLTVDYTNSATHMTEAGEEKLRKDAHDIILKSLDMTQEDYDKLNFEDTAKVNALIKAFVDAELDYHNAIIEQSLASDKLFEVEKSKPKAPKVTPGAEIAPTAKVQLKAAEGTYTSGDNQGKKICSAWNAFAYNANTKNDGGAIKLREQMLDKNSFISKAIGENPLTIGELRKIAGITPDMTLDKAQEKMIKLMNNSTYACSFATGATTILLWGNENDRMPQEMITKKGAYIADYQVVADEYLKTQGITIKQVGESETFENQAVANSKYKKDGGAWESGYVYSISAPQGGIKEDGKTYGRGHRVVGTVGSDHPQKHLVPPVYKNKIIVTKYAYYKDGKQLK